MEAQKPRLTRLADFQDALNGYEVSEHAKAVLGRTKLVVMCGLTGSGRNTIIDYLVGSGSYSFVVSDTTRPPKVRGGKLEESGVHYYFRSEDDILADLEAGEFVEAEIIHNQQVSGLSVRELQRIHEQGLIGIGDFETGGAKNIYLACQGAYIIALLPPSFKDWQDRLARREVMSSGEFKNRMQTAVKNLQIFIDNPYYKFIISDHIERSSKELRDLVENDKYTDEQHKVGLAVAKEMLSHTKALISSLDQ